MVVKYVTLRRMTESQIRRALATAGRRRSKARTEAAEQTAEIARLAPLALEAGVSKWDIATAAQISRPALDKLLAHD